MIKSELDEAVDLAFACSFTRQKKPTLQIEILRAVAQQILLRRGVPVNLSSKRTDAWLDGLLGRIAVVVGMSYAECGDAAKITDDEALMLIRELLLEADEAVIERHKGKRLPRRLRNMLLSF